MKVQTFDMIKYSSSLEVSRQNIILLFSFATVFYKLFSSAIYQEKSTYLPPPHSLCLAARHGDCRLCLDCAAIHPIASLGSFRVLSIFFITPTCTKYVNKFCHNPQPAVSPSTSQSHMTHPSVQSSPDLLLGG